MSEHIVLIHGLWMNGWDMGLLQYRCRRAGYAATRFKYDSTGRSPGENAGRLAALTDALRAEHLHFICHSLGGLVLRQYLARFPLARSGRVVMLGTPNNTSQAARAVAGWPGGPRLLQEHGAGPARPAAGMASRAAARRHRRGALSRCGHASARAAEAQ